MNYCVKCRTKTENKDPQMVQGGKRLMIKSSCGSCGSRKSCFAKKGEQGGSLQQAMAILKPIQSIAGSFVSDDFNAKIDKYLNGGAITNDMFKKGLMLGTDKEFQSKLSGMGLSGDGVGDDIKDFFNGVLLGFSNPMKGLKVLGKAMGLGVKGKGQKKGGGIVFL